MEFSIGLPLRPQNEVEIECGVDGIIDIRIGGHHELLVGQHLRQRVLVGIAVQAKFQHRVLDHLRRPLIVAQHDALVQNDSVQFHIVRLVGHANDIKIGGLVFVR